MARLPRPIRRFFRRLGGGSPSSQNPNQVNPQTVGLHPRPTTRLYLPVPIVLGLLVIGAAIGGAQIYQATHSTDAHTQIAVPGTLGSLHAVFLAGNQVFFGTLESVDRGSVVLRDVFYLQTQQPQTPNPSSAGTPPPPARGAQLVRRMSNDWHQPTHLSIPIDKIIMLEDVGKDSIVARLITEGRAREQGMPVPSPN